MKLYCERRCKLTRNGCDEAVFDCCSSTWRLSAGPYHCSSPNESECVEHKHHIPWAFEYKRWHKVEKYGMSPILWMFPFHSLIGAVRRSSAILVDTDAYGGLGRYFISHLGEFVNSKWRALPNEQFSGVLLVGLSGLPFGQTYPGERRSVLRDPFMEMPVI